MDKLSQKNKVSPYTIMPSVTTSDRVFINISGLVYETRVETLRRYPDTLLGDKRKRMAYFSPRRNEYFFNRHRESFSNILFFYQSSGKLCCPNDINVKVFVDECEFFQIPQSTILSMKLQRGGFTMEYKKRCLIQDKLSDIFRDSHKNEPTTLRHKIWEFCENPSSSKYARRFAYIYLFLLLISIVINCLKTVKGLRPKNTHLHDGWEITDIAINTYFLMEFIFRIIVSPSKKDFFKRMFVWIDIIALTTFVPLINKHYSNAPAILFFTPFQLFRVIRIFRLAKLVPEYNVAELILRSSLCDIEIFFCCLTLLVLFGGTILYNLEHNEKDTSFTSIPGGMYWAVQTFVTAGYGDMVPTTCWGKLFAALFMLSFIPTLSLPFLSVIIKFSRFYEVFNDIMGEGNTALGAKPSRHF